MKRRPFQAHGRDIQILYQVGSISGLTGRELIGHFTAQDGAAAQQAFEGIVERHWPMVIRVCRRVLGDEHAAADAFRKTQEDAARELGCAKGTVSGRLARAKDLLRARLARSGFAPAAALLGAALVESSAKAAVPPLLANGVTRAAMGVVLGRGEPIGASSSVVALTRGTMLAMLLGKLKAASIAILALVAFTTALAQTGASPEAGNREHRDSRQDAARSPASAAGTLPKPPDPELPEHARARLGTTRLRHEGYVGSFAFSRDGKTLASTGHDGVRFWEVATGAPVPAPRGLGDPSHVAAVEYSPDGGKMAIGYSSGLVKLLDLRTAEVMSLPQSHNSRVLDLAFAADGKTLATASPEDPVIRVWDVASGRERRKLAFREQIRYVGFPLALAFSPDGRRLAVGALRSAGRTGMIGIWELDGDAPPVMINNVCSHGLTSLVFSSDGRTVVSGGSDRRPLEGRQGPIPEPVFQVSNVAITPKIRIWDAATGRLVRELDPGKVTRLCKITLSRDGRTLVSIFRDRLIVWDLPSRKRTRTIAIPVADPGVGIGKSFVLAPDGRTIVASRGDQTVHLWDIATGALRLQEGEGHESAIFSVAITPDGRQAATGEWGGPIQFWDVSQGTHLRRIELTEGGLVRAVGFARNGTILGAAGDFFDPKASEYRGIVRLWDLPAATVKREFLVDDRAVRFALSADGRHVAIAVGRGLQLPGALRRKGGVEVGNPSIKVVDIGTGREIATFSGNGGEIQALAFSLDGKTLVSADASATFRCWDAATGHSIHEFAIAGYREDGRRRIAERPTWLAATAFAGDLKTAVTAGGSDDQLLVWDLDSGRVLRTILVDKFSDPTVALSPDGRLLAASLSPAGGKPDSFIRIWDVVTKREVLRLAARTGTVRLLVFSADGQTLVSGMSDTTALVWDISAAYEKVQRARD
ncbi:MAG: hypothetical protein ACLQIB_17995 [Isosphaeraceae bacterium]